MGSKRRAQTPHGIWGSVLLNVTPHGDIDWEGIREQLRVLCDSPLNGIYTNGTAGEFHTQTDSEYAQLTELVAAVATDNNMPFQIGANHSNPRIARQRIEEALQYNPAAIQFTLPDWWCLSEPELESFARGIQAAAQTTPLILYNPPHAKHPLSLSRMHDLTHTMPNLVGVKVVGGDESWYRNNAEFLGSLSVFVPGHTVAFGRPKGAKGSYSNVACLSPAGAVKHWRMIDTDLEAAIELEQRINRFMQVHVVPLVKKEGLSNTALDKLMAAAGNWCPMSARLLWPHHSASDEVVQSVAKAARSELPELFNTGPLDD